MSRAWKNGSSARSPAFNVRGERREDRVGVWVARPDKGPGFEDKIAAIGVRVRRWVSFHGISINVEPDLAHFSAIVPCGVTDPRYGVTSLADLGHPVTMADVDVALRQAFEEVFGATIQCGTRPRTRFKASATARTVRLPRSFSASGLAVSSVMVSTRADVGPRRHKRYHFRDNVGRSREQRLDAAVAPVAYPAFEIARRRLVFHPSAKADALHPAADRDLTDSPLTIASVRENPQRAV